MMDSYSLVTLALCISLFVALDTLYTMLWPTVVRGMIMSGAQML
jgi:hypothetical protein